MTIPVNLDSFRSDDSRVEVVFDLDELPNSDFTQPGIRIVIEAAVAALDAEHNKGPDHVTVMITGDERIRELNRVFKDEDEVTDVLSFNELGNQAMESAPDAEIDGDAWPEFPEFTESDGTGASASDRLGDIAISLPQVERQAAENSKSAERELAMLTVHGVLHLLGYDHAEPGEEKIMFGKTDVILAGLFGE